MRQRDLDRISRNIFTFRSELCRKEENIGFAQLSILFGKVPDILSQRDVERKRKRERERYAAVANSVKGRKRWEKSGRRSARFQLGCANVEDSRVQKQLLKIVILLLNEQVRLRIFFCNSIVYRTIFSTKFLCRIAKYILGI